MTEPTEPGTGFKRVETMVRDRIGSPAEQISPLNRKKKDRRGRAKPAPSSPERRIILRRPAEEPGLGLVGPFNYGALRTLQREREKYLLSTVHVAQPPPISVSISPVLNTGAAAVCEVCSEAAADGGAAFHFCVHDRVLVEAFRSPAGPIRRPHHVPLS